MSENVKKGTYKSCIVPQCRSTTVSTPHKLFISIPKDEETRNAWQRAMRRAAFVSNKGSRYCCEDHFNVEEDVDNYMYVKTMKNVRIRMKAGVLPHIFDCQKNRTSCLSDKSRKLLESEQQLDDTTIPYKEEDRRSTSLSKGTQINLKYPRRSKSVQCELSLKKTDPSENVSSKKAKLEDSISSTTNTSDSSSSSSELLDEPWNSKGWIEKRITYVIENNPKLYLGIPEESSFIIDMLSTKCEVSRMDIFLTMKKLKLNQPDDALADDFCMDPETIRTILENTIPKMVACLEPFVQWKSDQEVQEHLPVSFRHKNYNNVQSIIECLKISIEKPSDSVFQSDCRKFLVCCTPDGLISFISKGFDGRTTDTLMVEECGFLTLLQPGAHVMTHRGFDDLEELLASADSKLIRPPCVPSNEKYAKQEAKHMASLKIPVERVISRIRDFAILEQHAQIDFNSIEYLDMIVQIVCGIINLSYKIVII